MRIRSLGGLLQVSLAARHLNKPALIKSPEALEMRRSSGPGLGNISTFQSSEDALFATCIEIETWWIHSIPSIGVAVVEALRIIQHGPCRESLIGNMIIVRRVQTKF